MYMSEVVLKLHVAGFPAHRPLCEQRPFSAPRATCLSFRLIGELLPCPPMQPTGRQAAWERRRACCCPFPQWHLSPKWNLTRDLSLQWEDDKTHFTFPLGGLILLPVPDEAQGGLPEAEARVPWGRLPRVFSFHIRSSFPPNHFKLHTDGISRLGFEESTLIPSHSHQEEHQRPR